jgi:hypothetical protein
LDVRDYYEAPKYDAWDHQAWNVTTTKRSICSEYVVDIHKCQAFLKGYFPIAKRALQKRKDYCWKMYDNYNNCKRVQ